MSAKKTASSPVIAGGDILDQETAGKCTQRTIALFESLDVLVNNAGVFLAEPFREFTTDKFRRPHLGQYVAISSPATCRQAVDKQQPRFSCSIFPGSRLLSTFTLGALDESEVREA